MENGLCYMLIIVICICRLVYNLDKGKIHPKDLGFNLCLQNYCLGQSVIIRQAPLGSKFGGGLGV